MLLVPKVHRRTSNTVLPYCLYAINNRSGGHLSRYFLWMTEFKPIVNSRPNDINPRLQYPERPNVTCV